MAAKDLYILLGGPPSLAGVPVSTAIFPVPIARRTRSFNIFRNPRSRTNERKKKTIVLAAFSEISIVRFEELACQTKIVKHLDNRITTIPSRSARYRKGLCNRLFVFNVRVIVVRSYDVWVIWINPELNY